MKKKLFSPNDSCLKILTISQEVKFDALKKNNPDFQKLTNDLKIPSYSSFQMMKFKNELSNSTIPFQKILLKNSFNFQLNSDLLVQIINYYENQKDKISIDAISTLILLSYLSWSIKFYSENDFNGLSVILNSLIFISHSFNDQNDILFVNLSISSFYHSFTLFLSKKNFIDDFSDLIAPLNDFFIFNSNLPDPTFDILRRVGFEIISQNMNQQSSTEMAFFNVINNIYQLNVDIPSETAMGILDRSCFALRRLDFNVIVFFQNCSKLLDDQNLLKFLPIIPGALNEVINKSSIITPIPNYTKDYLVITEERTNSIVYQSSTISTFDSEPILTRIQFPPPVEWNLLIENANLKILNHLILILENRTILIEKFISFFFPFLTISIKSDHFIDFFSLFCYLCENLSNYGEIDFDNCILINEIIFNPSMTVYSNQIDKISTLRKSILNFLIKFKSYSLLKQLFLNNSSYPLLYAELIHRLFDYEIDFTDKYFVSTITQSLLPPMIFYQTLVNYDKSIINLVRNAILTYFDSIFQANETLNQFFSNIHFIRLFFALLFEEPLQHRINEYFTRFIINNTNCNNLDELIQLLNFVSSSEINHLTTKRSVQVMTFLLELVNLILSQYPTFCQTFDSLLSLIFNSISSLQKNKTTSIQKENKSMQIKETSTSTPTNEASIDTSNSSEKAEIYIPLLKTILKFITQISNSRILNLSEIYSLERSINNICGNEPDDEIAFLLINLFSKKNQIQHPSLVYLYLQSFFNSKKLNNCFIKLIELCNSNIDNCICLHEGEIDLLILKYIDIWRIDGNIEFKTLKHALNLFELISSHISAYEIVQKYISLLCPLEGKYLPYFNIEIIDKLHSLILKNSDFFMHHFLPLTDKNEITSSFSINSSYFAFGFWLKPLSTVYKRKTIVKITENEISLEIGLYGDLLVLTASNGQMKITHDFEIRPTIDLWSFISFSFDPDFLNVYINTTIIDSLNYSKYTFKKNLNVIVNVEKNTQSSLLGPFAFFTSLNKNDINRIVRKQGELNFNLICGFVPNATNSKFTITNLTQIQFHSNAHKITYPQNFVDIIYNYCKIESLIPLFAQIDMKYKNGNEINYFISILILVFQEFLTKSVDVQESFAQSSGFLIISHLLRNAKNHHFNYKLFKSFYTLFDQLKIQTTKKQLFEGILFNFEIWIKANCKEFILILKDLKKKIKLNKTIFIQNLDISKMISILQILFWYDPIETSIARCLNRSCMSFKDIKKCRAILFNISYQISKEKLSKNDIEVLIGSATTCRDFNQISDILDFIILLVNSKTLFFNTSLLRLLSIITLCQYELSFKIVFLFSLFDNFEMIVDELIINYYQYFNNQDLLIKLSKIKNKNVIRLISSILFRSNFYSNKAFKRILSIIQNKEEIDENEIWSIFLLFKLNTIKLKQKMIRYLVKTRSNFTKLFSVASLISQMLHDDDNVLILLILTMLDYSNENNMNQLKSIVIHFVFFRSNCLFNKCLLKLFRNSPFSDSLNEIEFNQINQFEFKDFSDPEIINQQFDLYTEKFAHSFNFGLHLNENGEWLDLELINKAINVLKINNEVILLIVNHSHSYKNFELIQDSFTPEKVHMKDTLTFLSVPLFKNHLFISQFTSYLERIQIAENLWSHFWRSMTTKKAPWYASIPSESKSKTHHKRDSTFCFAFCPFKTKRNFSFDSHRHASFSRDSGSFHLAKEKIDLMNSQKPSQFDLLSIDDFSEFEKSSRDSSQLNLNKANKIMFETKCNHITVQDSTESNFSIFSDYISIIHLNSNKMKIIEVQSIELVLLRTVLHRLTAIEIFTNTRQSYFIDFLEYKVQQNVLNVLKKLISQKNIQLTNFKQYFAEQNFLNDWMNRKISNFEYLMLLNIYSGRSFNSPSQYPFVPWILSDYQSESIDLNDEKVYRDLTKAIGIIQDERLSELISKQNELKRLHIEPFLFSSGPVCPLSVFLWLIRQEPFTSLHIEVQGGRFDHAARIFYSVRDSYRLATSHMNDFRELIPEFYFSPEFLLNSDNFDLGQLSDQKVNDVELPKWANNNPFEFVYTMRKAMESQFVSDNLNHWIDLIWGVRQKAEDNRYRSQMYSDVWETNQNIESTQKIEEIEAMLSQVGQIPPQLFNENHPKRNSKRLVKSIVNQGMNLNAFTDHVEILSSNVLPLNDLNTHFKRRSFPRTTFSEDNLRKHRFSSDSINVELQQSESDQVISKKPISKASIQISFLTSTGLIQNCFLTIHSDHGINENRIKIQSKSSQIENFIEIRNPNSLHPFSYSYISPFLVNSVTNSPSTIKKEQIEKSNSDNLFFIDNLKTENIEQTEQNVDLIFVGKDRTEVYLVSDNCDLDVYSNSCEVICLSSDGVYTAICGKDTVIHLFKKIEKDKQPVHSIISFYNSIVCCFVWSPFDTMVCGTKDCSLLICSLSKGEIVYDIDLHSILKSKSNELSEDLDNITLKMILITPSWGFILIYSDIILKNNGKVIHILSLLNINGNYIRSVELNFQISCWESFSTPDGFDYVLISDENGKLFLFEAFYLNPSKPIYRCAAKIVTVKFLLESNLVVAVSNEGKIFLIPYVFV